MQRNSKSACEQQGDTFKDGLSLRGELERDIRISKAIGKELMQLADRLSALWNISKKQEGRRQLE